MDPLGVDRRRRRPAGRRPGRRPRRNGLGDLLRQLGAPLVRRSPNDHAHRYLEVDAVGVGAHRHPPDPRRRGPRAGGLQAVPATRRVPRDVRGGGLARRDRALGAAAGAGCRTRRGARPVLLPVAPDLRDRDHRDLDGVRARAARARPARRPGRGEPVDRRRGRRAAVPGDRRPQRDALLLVARRRRPAARLPVGRARGGVPRVVHARWERRAPRPGGRTTDRRHARHGGPARHGGDEGRAVRSGGVGRLVPAADDARRRHAGVRQDLFDVARARRPLVPDRTDDPLRAAGGRDTRSDRSDAS